jgi:hypothetical protein
MEQVELGPYRTSWFGKDKEFQGMTLGRYIREKYIPAPGFHFVDWENAVYHLPVDQEIP